MTEKASRLTGYRQRRDQFFGQHPHSPLTEAQRARFTGLDYFPEQESLVLNLPLDDSASDVGDALPLSTTDGQVKEFFRAGVIRFEIEGEPVTLSVLRDGAHGSLFLPFRDSLSGSETYEVGRYLEPQQRPDGTLDIDFNYAYNPFCAYGDGWSCPLPPEDNVVSVAIRAGERAFHLPDNENEEDTER